MKKTITFFFTIFILSYQMPTFCYAFPTLTTPSTENVSAGSATLVLQSSDTGSGYFTLVPGSGTTCGTGSQIKAGQDSTGSPARYRGSLPLTANSPGRYTVRNLMQSTTYTICFTADSPAGQNLLEVPVTSNVSTSAAVPLANQEWGVVGSAGFSAGQATDMSLSFAPDGTPYISYRDTGNGYKATVMKYYSGSWHLVGSAGFSSNRVQTTALVFAPDGTPYVAYQDMGADSSWKATVMRFDGTSWIAVGNAGFTAGSALYTSLAFAPDGTPYLAYMDYVNSYKATVMRYSDGAWSMVGSAGFSAGQASSTSLAIAADGTPFVAYQDGGNGNKITVQKFNGNSWVPVGNVGFSAGTVSYTKLAFSPDNTPYVAFQDGGNSSKATAMKYNGSLWEPVGVAGFSPSSVGVVSLAFSPDGAPVVAFQDFSKAGKTTVMKYSGESWTVMGSSGFSSASANPVSLSFSPNGRPYVAYGDSSIGWKATVMTLDNAITTTTVSSDKLIATTGQLITFTATVSRPAATGMISFMDGTTLLGTAPLSNGIATYGTSALTVGIHSITAVYAGDSIFNGSTSVSQRVEIVLVGTAVTTVISSPVTGYMTNASGISVSGTAAGVADDPVKLVEVSADGGTTWQPASGTTSWSISLVFPLEGIFNIKSRATTIANAVETPKAGISVTIDRTAPTGSILSAVLNNATSITIALNTRANTPGMGCLDVLPIACGYQDITLSYNYETWTPWVQASAKQQYSITMVGQQKAIYAKLRDSTGNVSEVLSAPITAAVVTSAILSPATGYLTKAASITISGTATSVVYDPVRMVEVSADGGSTWQPATGTTLWNIALPFPSDGSFTIKSRATTWSGVAETPAAGISVAIDRTAPTGSIVSAVYKDGTALTVSLNANAHDPGTVCVQIFPAPICGYMEISLSYDGMNWTPWQEASTTKQYSIVTAGLPGIVYAKLRDSIGNVSTVLSASVQYIGVCGSANKVNYSAAPTSDLCSGGEPSSVTGIGPWKWSCTGLNNGTTANCSAPQAGGVVYRSSDAGITWSPGKTGIGLNTGASPLLVSPNYSSDHTLFLGADGIYRSTDSGDTWAQVLSGYLVRAFVASPAYVTDRTVFAGAFLSGIHKSTDGGTTWTSSNVGLPSTMVFSLAISPDFSSDHTIFAGNSGGVFKSTDGGASWFVANTGTTNVAALSLAISPAFASDQTIFAAISSNVYKSTDGGSSWALLDSGISGSVNALGISPGYASDQTLFATTSSGVYKSTDRGTIWGKINSNNSNSISLSPDYTSDQTLFAGMFGVNVFNSTDGGGTWTASNSNFAVSNQLASLSISPSFGSDQTAFAVAALAAPIMGLSTYNLAFNQIKTNGASLTKQITIFSGTPKMIGMGNLDITSMTLTGKDADQFTISPGTCYSQTPNLINGGQCSFNATFSPTSTGSKNATLEIVSNEFAANLTTISLTGTGITATSSISIPTSGFTTNAPSISVSGSADCSAGDSVTLVEVSIDGGTTWLPATGTTSWSIDLGLPGFGSYSVISRATTSEGVVETPGAGITAIRSPAVGVCGDDHSKVLSSLAPILLCATGISSEVSGNGHPWIWNCQGDSGTDPTQCSASIRTYGISVTVPDGLGKGDVNADMISNDDSPKSMFCPKSLCSAQYDFGKTVILTATPDPISLFTSWTGHCDNEHCKLEMTGDKAVTANFSRAHSFKIVKSGILDDSLETLMELADPGNEIRMLATELTINNLILSKALTLTGGWNALQELPTTESTTLIGTIKIVETDAVIKNTTVKGMITIQSGSLKVDSLTIRP